ncbi:matrixin family metalloprotease [Hazenella coriacea]|uniref:Matrixin n=1 Tax=Hazenella coriacea TaxID=1179467 RepID=A0A4R3LBZ9_9BACL|nr:matrixin family metalloprotease [Hazenella coriacea]TCS96765.1 matrixin [Hazenella coriacea]
MRKLVAVIFTITIIFCFLIPFESFAYNTFNQHKLKGGVGAYGKDTQYYYIDSTAGSQEERINWSFNSCHTTSRLGITTPISFRRQAGLSSPVIDIYQYNDLPSNYLAYTEMKLIGSGTIDPYKQNWDYGRIVLNTPGYSTLSDFNRRGTIGHEIGHAMGLAHTTASTFIMTQLGSGRTVNQPMGNDLAGINFLY